MIQIKRPTTIYLSIGGFNIKIMRIPRTKKIFLDEPILDINSLFRGFLIKRSKKINHIIIIEKNPQPLILQKKKMGKMNNFLYFYQDGGKQTRTFSHISEFQFKHILSGILLRLLSKSGGFILHASGILRKKRATLFVGKSGAGKSTAVQLLKSKFVPIADDNVIVRKLSDGNYWCYQTPFSEKNDIGPRKHKGYVISETLFLKKSTLIKQNPFEDKQLIWDKLSKQMFTDLQYTNRFFKNLLSFINQSHAFYTFYFFVDKQKMINFFNKQDNQNKKTALLVTSDTARITTTKNSSLSNIRRC